MYILKIASFLDDSGHYELSDKLFNIARNYGRVILAEQGVFNPIGYGGIDLKKQLTSLLVYSFVQTPTGYKLDYNSLNNKIGATQLSHFINNIELEPMGSGGWGSYNYKTKVLTLNADLQQRDIQNIINTLEHELVHATSPIYQKQLQQINNYRQILDKHYDKFNPEIDALQKEITDAFQDYRANKITGEQYAAIANKNNKKINDIEWKRKQTSPQVYGIQTNRRGRTSYFTDEEIMAQTTNLKNAFMKDNLIEVYKRYYSPDWKKFQSDMRNFAANLPKMEALVTELNSPKYEGEIKKNIVSLVARTKYLNEYRDALQVRNYQKVDEIEHLIMQVEKERIMLQYMPWLNFADKVEDVSGEFILSKIKNIKDPKWFSQFRKSISNDINDVEIALGIKQQKTKLRSEILEDRNKVKKTNVNFDDNDYDVNGRSQQQKKLDSDIITKNTAKIVGNQVSTPKSKNALSSALPIISKLFKQLGEYLQKNLDKLNNSKAGKVFNFAMLVKDIYFIITTADKISKQITAGEEVMVKDQYDLGLTIVSLLTDQQTQAILRGIFPPIIVLLNNPQIQAWLVTINIGANLLSGAVSVADHLGTISGTSNKSESATSGIMNTPGSLQALVMPVFQLRDKYGEVYNALIDVEKGLSVPQAISKHIMKDASGAIDPYRLSLFYKFRNNKNKIIQYQNSAAFKKLPEVNQLLYPSANSAYAISSYKKARDAQEQRRREQSGSGVALPAV